MQTFRFELGALPEEGTCAWQRRRGMLFARNVLGVAQADGRSRMLSSRGSAKKAWWGWIDERLFVMRHLCWLVYLRSEWHVSARRKGYMRCRLNIGRHRSRPSHCSQAVVQPKGRN